MPNLTYNWMNSFDVKSTESSSWTLDLDIYNDIGSVMVRVLDSSAVECKSVKNCIT
jgi:hypothetical protein